MPPINIHSVKIDGDNVILGLSVDDVGDENLVIRDTFFEGNNTRAKAGLGDQTRIGTNLIYPATIPLEKAKEVATALGSNKTAEYKGHTLDISKLREGQIEDITEAHNLRVVDQLLDEASGRRQFEASNSPEQVLREVREAADTPPEVQSDEPNVSIAFRHGDNSEKPFVALIHILTNFREEAASIRSIFAEKDFTVPPEDIRTDNSTYVQMSLATEDKAHEMLSALQSDGVFRRVDNSNLPEIADAAKQTAAQDSIDQEVEEVIPLLNAAKIEPAIEAVTPPQPWEKTFIGPQQSNIMSPALSAADYSLHKREEKFILTIASDQQEEIKSELEDLIKAGKIGVQNTISEASTDANNNLSITFRNIDSAKLFLTELSLETHVVQDNELLSYLKHYKDESYGLAERATGKKPKLPGMDAPPQGERPFTEIRAAARAAKARTSAAAWNSLPDENILSIDAGYDSKDEARDAGAAIGQQLKADGIKGFRVKMVKAGDGSYGLSVTFKGANGAEQKEKLQEVMNSMQDRVGAGEKIGKMDFADVPLTEQNTPWAHQGKTTLYKDSKIFIRPEHQNRVYIDITGDEVHETPEHAMEAAKAAEKEEYNRLVAGGVDGIKTSVRRGKNGDYFAAIEFDGENAVERAESYRKTYDTSAIPTRTIEEEAEKPRQKGGGISGSVDPDGKHRVDIKQPGGFKNSETLTAAMVQVEKDLESKGLRVGEDVKMMSRPKNLDFKVKFLGDNTEAQEAAAKFAAELDLPAIAKQDKAEPSPMMPSRKPKSTLGEAFTQLTDSLDLTGENSRSGRTLLGTLIGLVVAAAGVGPALAPAMANGLSAGIAAADPLLAFAGTAAALKFGRAFLNAPAPDTQTSHQR